MNDKGQACYEETCVQAAKIGDIDMDLVEDYCKVIGYGKVSMDFLQENHGYLIEKNGEFHPTVVALLLFGKKPQDFLPRASIRFIRYDGMEEKVGKEMNVIKDVVFEGTIRQQIDKAVAYLSTQIKERTYLGDKGLFVTELEYPEFVRQEMTANAACHRDYSISGTDIQIKLFDDRLVVESPGNLPGLVRPDNIRHTHFSRNPRIARYLKAYTYVKEFGEGVDRMCREMEADGLLPIKYYKNDFILKAVAWSKNAKLLQVGKSNDNHPKSSDKVAISGDKVAISWADIKDNCNKNTIIILEYLMSHYSITNVIAREITGLSSSGVRKIFSNLVTNKIVKAQGSNRDKSYTLIMHFIDR
ncbi:MAG: ATP-dependent DNA helicase RecG [Bacteroides intestinalis]|nr:ATP-dependent DNA helicase RecG [Bacteroides intestinalis]